MGKGNIIGEGFAKEIKAQVEQRQKTYGAINRSNDQLRYFNAREPWIKLTSSTNIDTTVLDRVSLPSTYSASSLAQAYVLFGGAAKDSGTKLRGGLEGVYNIENAAGEYGYRPMPGITSIESKNRNRGSVRETTINIKAYTSTQFNIIDLLYLRIGYTILLEWGHTLYLDNDGNVKEFIATDTLSSPFLNGDYIDQKQVLDAVSKNKIKFVGNYDAVYGKVSNFNWSYETDGSYTISITVMSLGDVIESLKMNLIPNPLPTDSPFSAEEYEKQAAKTDEEAKAIQWLRYRDAIAKLFYQSATKLIGVANYDITISMEFDKIATISDNVAKELGFQKSWDVLGLTETTLVNENRYFVRFGAFLQWLQENQLLYGKSSSIFEIDYDEEKNLIFTTPYVLSADPRICIVPTTIEMSDENYNVFPSIIPQFKTEVEGIVLGKLMNVYINMAFINKKMGELKDDNNNVPLYTLLEAICEGINSSLGSINKIQPVIDEEDNNRVYFLDETPIPNRNAVIKKVNENSSTELTSFQIYGYQQDNSSFITNFGIKTEITNELGTMVTIGAQANGASVGEDATAFSKWSEGIIDRILPIKSTQAPVSGSITGSQTQDINTKYPNITTEYSKFVSGFSDENNITYDGQVDYFPELLKNFLEYNQAKESLETQKISPTSMGFIPLNLNLTMVGLSGMKIYQKFTITQKFLPANYPECIEFLIKTISHKVDQGGWYTTLDSLGYPKEELLSKGADPSITYINPAITTEENTSAGGGGNSGGNNTISGTQRGQCGADKVQNTNPPGYDTDSASLQTRLNAIKAMSLQANPFSVNYQEPNTARCARYTYNHAVNFVKAIKGQPVSKGGLVASGGNANESGFWNNLISLGYTQNIVGKNLSKAETISLINNIEYNIGDVLVYYNNVDPSGQNIYYYHAQFYAGLPSNRKDKDGKAFTWKINKSPYGGDVGGTTGWTTDNATNYNSNFVYKSKSAECWVVLLFRYAGNASVVDKAKSLKQYEYIVNELNKILELKDANVYTGGTDGPLLEQFKSAGGDDEDGAVKTLQQLVGTVGQPNPAPYWYNKLNYKTLITDPNQQAHFLVKFNELLSKVQGGNLLDTYTWYYPDLTTNQDTDVYKDISTDF